jgi:hypothetical protein
MPEFKSSNFEFLSDLDPPLAHREALAERYCLNDPNAALVKLRLFGELLAKNIAARFGVYADTQFQQIDTRKAVDQYEAFIANVDYSVDQGSQTELNQGENRVPNPHQ